MLYLIILLYEIVTFCKACYKVYVYALVHFIGWFLKIFEGFT